MRERGEADVTLERQLSTNPNKGSVVVDCSVLATFPKFHNFQKEKQSGLNLGVPSTHDGD